MAKKTPTALVQPRMTRRTVFCALIIGWLAVLTIYTVTVAQSIYRFSYASADQTVAGYYQTFRIQFCYENDIKPCDDIAIGEWNKNHPDNTFSLTRPSIGTGRQ